MVGPFLINAQSFLEQGKVSGNFEADVQTYQPDIELGITDYCRL
jgi:hypothetical protein